jgi:hypothetical protein
LGQITGNDNEMDKGKDGNMEGCYCHAVASKTIDNNILPVSTRSVCCTFNYFAINPIAMWLVIQVDVSDGWHYIGRCYCI